MLLLLLLGEADAGGGGGGKGESEGLVLPYVVGGVGRKRVEDLEVEGLELGGGGVFWGLRIVRGEVGEDRVEDGVVGKSGVILREYGRRGVSGLSCSGSCSLHDRLTASTETICNPPKREK